MKKQELAYIQHISLKSIRDYILDNNLSENDTIILHTLDFDKIVLEYKDIYSKSLELPFFIFDTLVEENRLITVPLGRIMVIKNDDRIVKSQITTQKENPIYGTIYRCGWCGNIVDFDGSMLDSTTWFNNKRILENPNNVILEERVHGKCCPNKI